MSKNNDVFAVLVTSGNQAPLIINKRLEDLAPGQIGVFSAKDNTSITAATVLSEGREFYLAVGVDRDEDTVTDDVVKSSGIIQIKNISAYTARCYNAPQPQITDITGFTAKCDTEYFVKVGVKSQTAYANYGFNYPFKSFVVHTSCCETSCGGCPEGSQSELAGLIVSTLNADTENIFTATAFAYGGSIVVGTAPTADGNITVGVGAESFIVAILDADTTAGVATKIAAEINATTASIYVAYVTGSTVRVYRKVSATGTTDAVTYSAGSTGSAASSTPDFAYAAVADITAFNTANPGAGLGVRVTTTLAAIVSYCKTNLDYQFPRGASLDVILSNGFECNGATTVTQALGYEEGSGYDIAHLEYTAGGWNGKPGVYRQSELVGESIGDFDNFAVKTGKYVQINITSDQESNAGWGSYKNGLNTTIAVPCGENTTLAGLLAILDRAVSSNFGPLADDIAECPSCTTAQATSALDSEALDGIG